jgi:hypothetical protein
MNDRYDDFLYQSGLTAQGCWESLDDYAKEAIIRFGDLIVKECVDIVLDSSIEYTTRPRIAEELKQHFGVKE